MLPFVIFGFTVQVLLLAFFAAHLWHWTAERSLGRLVYGAGAVAVLLAVAYLVSGEPWHLVMAFALYAAWSAFGALIDIVRPISWRQPARWSIVLPYAALLIASLLALWVPLWWVDRGLWVAFGVLYAAHTTLNVISHRGTPSSPPGSPSAGS